MLNKEGASFLHGKVLNVVSVSVCSTGFLLFGYDQ